MRRLLFVLFLLAIPAILSADQPVREWKSKSGKTIIEASLDVSRNSNPEMVYLLQDGKRFKVPFKNLSKADQEYVTRARSENNSPQVGKRSDKNVSDKQRYALLIGVNQYSKPFKSLQYGSQDMKLLAKSFEQINIPKEQIILVTDDSSDNFRPTGENIRREIETITSRMKPDDQLVIVFRGQGATVEGKSYLCPGDANQKDINSIVSLNWVVGQLKKCKSKEKLFIFDANRNEIAFDGVDESGSQDDAIDDGLILITSCKNNQQSWEHPDIKHGVFVYFFAEGLSGAAKDKDDSITVKNVFDYANYKTKMFVYKMFDEVQTPTYNPGSDGMNFCLFKVYNPDSKFKAGDRKTIKVNGVEFAFRWCPPGTFLMGTPKDEFNDLIKKELGDYFQYIPNDFFDTFFEQYAKLEKQHKVTLTRGFWMMETEVTVGMFKAFVDETGYVSKGKVPEDVRTNMHALAQSEGGLNMNFVMRVYGSDDIGIDPWRNPGFPQDNNNPVTCISWNEAVAFCKWLSKKTGLNIHLPTEAQWEYACRAGTTGAVAGNLDEMAWYSDAMKEMMSQLRNRGYNNGDDDTRKAGLSWVDRVKTHPVGQKKPNAWGFYDMYGNVSEWCQDFLGEYPSGSVTDPTGPSTTDPNFLRFISSSEITDNLHVTRGGSTNAGSAVIFRSSARHWGEATERSTQTGFRCAMEPSND